MMLPGGATPRKFGRRMRLGRYGGLFLAGIACSMLLSSLFVSSGSETPSSASPGARALLWTNSDQTNFDWPLNMNNGSLICYILGMFYMFLALAIVCDEFFVPALEVLTEKVGVSDDVAGATFMAAGGSAPELFTSFIGQFSSPPSAVGFATIVGSAVFNVLFVIGACAIFSKGELKLTWWPLFRDCVYYTISLAVLATVFKSGEDGCPQITWQEALLLLDMYLGYVILMAYNERIYKWISSLRAPSQARSRTPNAATGSAMSDDRKSMLKKKMKAVGHAKLFIDAVASEASKKKEEEPKSETEIKPEKRGFRSVPSTTFRAGVFQLLCSEVDSMQRMQNLMVR
jgi:Ca2+/Na+ antiporter